MASTHLLAQMKNHISIPRLLSALLLFAGSLQAQILTQTLTLQPGWNSIWLEVEPSQPDPDVLFAGQPVEMVTTFMPLAAKYTSLRDPASDTWKDAEWRTWQPATASGAFLNNLHQLTPGQGYLIKATDAVTVTIAGKAMLNRFDWRPQSFNLVGLPVDPAASITLGAFFANSPAHTPLRAFRLLNGKWVQASSAEPAVAGRAYWIWCGTGSDHQGPVSLRTSSNIVLNAADSQGSVEFRPAGASALTISITATGSLPLARLGGAARTAISGTQTLTAVAGEWTPFRIGHASLTSIPAASAASLLEIRCSGVLWRVPVTCTP
jgi:hypothetical protein